MRTPPTIGARVALARGLAELSASRLSLLSGLARTHVSLLEAERRTGIDGQTAVALATTLGVSTDWLLTGKGPDPDPEAVAAAVSRAVRAAARKDNAS